MKTLEQNIKLSVNLAKKLENFFPELKSSPIDYLLLNVNIGILSNEQ